MLVFMLVVLGTVSSSAQTRRENEPDCNQHSARKMEIADADATILDLAIGRASLKDVQAKLGSAKVTRVSSEEESDIGICYVSPADGTVLVFYSGAMGGWKDITWFALWSRTAAFPHTSQCTPSAKVSQSLSTRSGLRLGLRQAQLKEIVGTSSTVEGSSLKYDYVCRQRMTDEEVKSFKAVNNWDVTSNPYFDRMSWIEVHFTNAAASRIEIGKTDSY